MAPVQRRSTEQTLQSGSEKDGMKKDFKEGVTQETSVFDVAEGEIRAPPLQTAEDLVTTVIGVDDDPSLSPWTFRMFFIGIGLSTFSAVLQEIMYFKPQTVLVSVIFLTILSHMLGTAMEAILPTKGAIGRFLNPFPWNRKEHTAAVLMSSAAAVSALSTEALAVQKLWYGGYPSQVAGIFITLSSQAIGFGLAGMMRTALVRPTKMLYPSTLPITTLLETLHKPRAETRQRFNVFWIIFGAIFVWEWFPEYIFPFLSGISIFCLANQHSLVFTNLFGGAQGNEGMGFLSLCLDWNYISNPLSLPLPTLLNSFIGYMGGIVLSMALYYGNVWGSKNYPFMSQLLYSPTSTPDNPIAYNQTAILNADFSVDDAMVDKLGVPHITSTYVIYLITSNIGVSASIVHILLWNYEETKLGWSWITKDYIKSLFNLSGYAFWKNSGRRSQEEKDRLLSDPEIDPHYKLMVDYDEVPNSWYLCVFVISWVVGLVCLYVMKSTLPWWGYIIGTVLLALFMMFLGAQFAITGFQASFQTFFQMLAGYMFPGRPLANMYFNTYTYNALGQGFLLLSDVKLAQQNKLSPKATFVSQITGCLIGALLNFVMMITIVHNQADVLKSAEGTNVWSGQNIQQFNTLSISWSIAPKMFSVGAQYQWVTLGFLVGIICPIPFYLLHRLFPKQKVWSYLNTAIITSYLGILFVGLNASLSAYFIVGFFAQFYMRRYKPHWFSKWNYLVSAALDGGTQVMVFIATFAVFGASGKAVNFPAWWGNHQDNLDFCKFQG